MKCRETARNGKQTRKRSTFGTNKGRQQSGPVWNSPEYRSCTEGVLAREFSFLSYLSSLSRVAVVILAFSLRYSRLSIPLHVCQSSVAASHENLSLVRGFAPRTSFRTYFACWRFPNGVYRRFRRVWPLARSRDHLLQQVR